jgi:LPS-assembly protein
VAADRVRALLGGAIEAERVRAYLKAAPVDLSAAATPEEARAAGQNALAFSGDRLSADARGRFRLVGARLTLCDCGADAPPSWEVRAREADVVPGVRAVLSNATVYVAPPFLGRSVPVLWLPKMYVPLGERQTGFLLPELDDAGKTGAVIGLPLFVTLGRSADLTLTPSWAFGGDTVKGPAARLELRWAPAEEAAGRFEVAVVDDRLTEAEPDPMDGLRFALEGDHAQRLGAKTRLSARLALAGDPRWPSDFRADRLARDAGYQRSSLLLSRRSDAVVLEAGAQWLQPFGGAEEGYGTFGAGRDGMHRLPFASAVLLPASLGPLALDGRAGIARFSPASADVDPLDRIAATRADGRLELSAPLLAAGALAVRPYVRAAGAAYVFEDGAPTSGAAWGLAGVVASTEVSRRYGALRHEVTPRLEWRAGTGTVGDGLTSIAYDGFDRTSTGLLSAAPPGRLHQLRVSVETRVTRGASTPLRLELGQDLDLEASRAGETFVGAGVAAGPLSADGTARFLAFADRAVPAPEPAVPSALDPLTELRASASLALGRRLSVRGGILSVGPGASGTLVAGPDALFDLRPAGSRGVGSATAGARLAAGPAILEYEATLAGRAQQVQTCSGGEGSQRNVTGSHVLQHRATFVWESPCRCFRLLLRARLDDCGVFSPHAQLELTRPTVR